MLARFVLGGARRMSLRRLPFPRSIPLVVAFAVVLLLLVALPSRASAQTITVTQETSLARLDASGQQIAKRPVSLNPEAINARDCREGQRIRFPVVMTGFQPHAVVQVWASTGSDCAIPMNRAGDAAPCWSVVPSVPIQANVMVDVPVRALLSPTADETACGTVDLTTIDVQVLMFSNADADTAIVSKHVTIVADTVGPEPPTASIFAGNGRARVEVRALGGGIQSIAGVKAYCEKSAAPNACVAAGLVPRDEPDPTKECGSVVGSTGSTFFTDPLGNGENHAVAVAAMDAFGNVGPLSTIACTVPSPDAETKVQSLEEPTGCAIGAATRRARGGAFAAFALLGASVLAIARRRRAARAF
jgi:hypothetical protein